MNSSQNNFCKAYFPNWIISSILHSVNGNEQRINPVFNSCPFFSLFVTLLLRFIYQEHHF